MKNIVAFAGSNSSVSINHKLVVSVCNLINSYNIELLKLRDFNIPMFGEDIERDSGYPESIKTLHEKFINADGLIISTPEHNGGLPAFFKNILDWLSRLERSFLNNKKIFLLGTSPGRGGALGSMEQGRKLISAFNGEVTASFSLPSFNRNFSEGNIINDKLKAKFQGQLDLFLTSF